MKCRCDGRYEGCEHGLPCSTPPGGHRSPYFCADCDPRRITHVVKQLRGLEADFRRRQRERTR